MLDEIILKKIMHLLKAYGCDEQEINNFITDLKEMKDDQFNDDDNEMDDFDNEEDDEYNPEQAVSNIIGKDFDLEKDAKLKELIKNKYKKQ